MRLTLSASVSSVADHQIANGPTNATSPMRELANPPPPAAASGSSGATVNPCAENQPTEFRAWDEAFRRVESYLRALGIESRVQLNSLVTEVIAAAEKTAVDRPDAEPVTLAMQEVDARIGAWFERILGVGACSDERFDARGRLALIMADVPTRWPRQVLSDDAIPKELSDAMNACDVQAGPEVRFTNMAPRPIEFSGGPSDGNLRHSFTRGPLLRAGALWFLIIGLLGVAWAAGH